MKIKNIYSMLPRVPARLHCGCQRHQSINTDPTKRRGPLQDVHHQLRKFLKQHKTTLPDDFSLLTKDVDLDWLSVVRPNHFNDRLDDLSKQTSPGIYYQKKGFRTKADVIEHKSNELRYYCHMIKTGRLRNPRPLTKLCTVDTKEDTRTGEMKSRVAWIYPIQVCAIENMWFSSIKDQFPEDYVPKPETHHAEWCNKQSHSVDFSSFDASVCRPLVERALDILESHFDNTMYASGDVPYNRTSLDRLWKFVRWYFLNTPVLIKDRVIHKVHGVPSGSMFTNIIDTLISRLIMTYVHRSEGCQMSCITYGDDCHVKDCTCRVSSIVNSVNHHFGMQIKVEEPNEHGCLTYCKAECHKGQPYHDGLWFANILNCASATYRSDVAQCLCYMRPTRFQLKQLDRLVYKKATRRLHPRFETYIAKLLTSGNPDMYTSLKERGPVPTSL